MKLQLLCSALIVITLFSCGDIYTDDIAIDSTIELIDINIDLELPSNSNVVLEDLTISTLFSESIPGTDSSVTVQSFSSESMEVAFASNAAGNLVMLNYFNPAGGEPITMNSRTTASALVMLHPWTFDLSVVAKQQAIDFIEALPEYEAYHDAVSESISSGQLDPLTSSEILDLLSDIQNKTFNRVTEYLEPLKFDIDESTVSVENTISSATYAVGLYNDQDELLEVKEVKGRDKTHFLFQEFIDQILGNSSTANDNTAKLTIPENGEYVLKAKSGLSFDGSAENRIAAYSNTRIVTANILGIFSSELKKIAKIDDKCFITLGETIWDGIRNSSNISGSFEEFGNGNISGYQLTLDIVSYIADRTDQVSSILEDCAPDGSGGSLVDTQTGFMKKILKLTGTIGRLSSVFNTTAMLTDWVQFDKSIELCFEKTSADITKCPELTNQIKILNTGEIIDFNPNFRSLLARHPQTFCSGLYYHEYEFFPDYQGTSGYYANIEFDILCTEQNLKDGTYALGGDRFYDRFYIDIPNILSGQDFYIDDSHGGVEFKVSGGGGIITFKEFLIGTNAQTDQSVSLGEVEGRFIIRR